MTRRTVLATLASTVVLPLTSCRSGRGMTPPAKDADANTRALLDELAESLLRLSPEGLFALSSRIGPRTDNSGSPRSSRAI
jgi:hypothetical protein